MNAFVLDIQLVVLIGVRTIVTPKKSNLRVFKAGLEVSAPRVAGRSGGHL